MTDNPAASVTLETDRLTLRPMAAGDVAFLYRHFGDTQVNRWLVDNLPPASEADAQAIIDFYVPAQRSRNRWIIEIKETTEPIGTIGFHLWEPEHSRAEIGYDLSAQFWQQGFGTEAVRAALAFGFTTLALHRVEAYVHVDNMGSRRLLEGLGFRLEGTARENYFARGSYHDHWCFACLEGELI